MADADGVSQGERCSPYIGAEGVTKQRSEGTDDNWQGECRIPAGLKRTKPGHLKRRVDRIAFHRHIAGTYRYHRHIRRAGSMILLRASWRCLSFNSSEFGFSDDREFSGTIQQVLYR